MERRDFIKTLVSTIALGGLLIVSGCKKEERIPRSGNQEKLWKMATGQLKTEEPMDLSYAKDTPAFYRDASLGKVDPSFAPKVGGG